MKKMKIFLLCFYIVFFYLFLEMHISYYEFEASSAKLEQTSIELSLALMKIDKFVKMED